MHVYPPVSRGSSPHTRGAHPDRRRLARLGGIIPAYAGSTGRASSASKRPADHPRIRGEHPRTLHSLISSPGSSPHTRGAHIKIGTCFEDLLDHPRIRGEHRGGFFVDSMPLGSSPHTRGAHSTTTTRPRGRRIIPAYAGSTGRERSRLWTGADHPRIRGEHSTSGDALCMKVGSSPHTRGALVLLALDPLAEGIIPAYAGSTPEDPRHGDGVDGSSPHTRGAQRRSAIFLAP